MSDDHQKRSRGAFAAQARESIDDAIWGRSCELMRQAEALHSEVQLTPERSQAILIALIEQNRLISRLESQVSEGIRAVKRIEKETAPLADGESPVVKLPGNRFTRSRA